MENLDEEEEEVVSEKPSPPPVRRRAKKLRFPRRTPSIVIPPREPVYITAEKTVCIECRCYPKEDPYVKPKKLNHCQRTPLTLYELAAAVVDGLHLPEAFKWQVCDVVQWFCEDIGLPQYQECIIDNHIDGMRLLMLEDTSKLPMINIHDFGHITVITSAVRSLYGMDVVRFARSHGLPSRRLQPHTTWFKSRTGPSWGSRLNWTRYWKPDFPKTMFARVPPIPNREKIPHYIKTIDVCNEILVPRKFRLNPNLPEHKQLIWMERTPNIRLLDLIPEVRKRTWQPTVPRETRLSPNKISAEGLTGKQFMLARRLMPRRKFFVK